MHKTYLLILFLLFSFLSASAANVDPKVDPEKENKKSKNKNEEQLLEKGDMILSGKEIVRPVEDEKSKGLQPTIKKVKAKQEETGEDVQSFNFLYYIIHQFKFSDFMTD